MAEMKAYQSNEDENIIALEKVDVSDDEDEGFEYNGVDNISDVDSDDDDYLSVLASMNYAKSPEKPDEADSKNHSKPTTQVRPSVVDDFIRNFLIKMGMTRSLDAFNTEWYEFLSKGKLKEEDIGIVPDIYIRNQTLDDQVKGLRIQITKMEEITAKAKGTWDKFRKERDFHRMHHKRVAQEKEKLMVDIQRLKKHYSAYEPTIKEYKAKYETAMKEKMLTRLEKDRLAAIIDQMKAQQESNELVNTQVPASRKAQSKKFKKVIKPSKEAKDMKDIKDTKLPSDANANNPYSDASFDPVEIDRFQMSKTFRGHVNAVSAIAFHPTNPIMATVSDDETWKLWSIPNCELVMSGEGHHGWVSGVDFHPQGTHLATCSGDNTIKIWDFVTASCSATLTDHSHPIWETAFHHEGDFLISCSMDHTAKLWDVHTARCRHTIRGHVDSVNTVCFLPFSNSICTGSGDKTVSVWDIRSNTCVLTFYGHENAVNNVTTTLNGNTIASCDADGIVKVWDIRMVAERNTLISGDHALNKLSFDRSGSVLTAACDDGTIKVFNANPSDSGQALLRYSKNLQGHEDAVQAVRFDPADKFLASAGSDCTFRLWTK